MVLADCIWARLPDVTVGDVQEQVQVAGDVSPFVPPSINIARRLELRCYSIYAHPARLCRVRFVEWGSS
jgi:hypothetical protein